MDMRKEPLEISTISHLPGNTEADVDALRHYIADQFSTKKALLWRPHVTLAPRVLIPRAEIDRTVETIRHLAKRTGPILTRTAGLVCDEIKKSPLENPYVIRLKVLVTPELEQVHAALSDDIYEGFVRPSIGPRTYQPNITLAFRDLVRVDFLRAKEYFTRDTTSYEFPLELDSIILMLHRGDDTMEEYKSFALTG